MRIGPYSGDVADRYRAPEVLAGLESLPALLAAPGAAVIAEGRNRHVRVEVTVDGRAVPILVKRFGSASLARNALDRRRGTKAQRTWIAAAALAARGVGTPPPVAYLDRWDGARLAESYFLAEFLPGRVSFMDALVTLFHEDPVCAKFMALLEIVAGGIRGMHDAGFVHRDLGNQNILLLPDGQGCWRDPMFIDLNRGRLRDRLSMRDRGRDLSRIALPSDFLRVFLEMYWRDVPPAELLGWERHYRRRFGWHSRTRRWRHPLREARQAVIDRGRRTYPREPDMWVWDDRSAQAISVLRSCDRGRYYPISRHLRLAADTLSALPGVWPRYRAALAGAFQAPVSMARRVGVALEPTPDTHARELEYLSGLGQVPVMVRFYHHEPPSAQAFRVEAVHALRAAGHPVSIALVQDRQAVRDPARWRAFGESVLHGVGDAVEMVELAHAINRVKWGVWDLRELRGLYAAAADLRRAFPGVSWIGPAAIDFEYPFVLSALRAVPAGLHFAALSHHLYVDRRGAPENRQGFFGAVEKFALARAIAGWSPACDNRLIVSEVNWPILGTGVYSPVNSPYESPGPRYGDPSVSEDVYANYMLRYLCLALCSGLVERVYWWRLAARGFGLVDDTNPSAWRARPAYHMLSTFLRQVGHSRFVRAQMPEGARHGGDPRGRYAFCFERETGGGVTLAYAHETVEALGDGRTHGVCDAFGRPVAGPVTLTGRPVYLHEPSDSMHAGKEGERT